MKKPRFKKKETGYHQSAVKILAAWVNGEIEKKFYVNGMITFVADVACMDEGRIYEVVYTHPIDGKKLGFIQEWCFRNATELSIFEVSADYILSQTEKPEQITQMEMYEIKVI